VTPQERAEKIVQVFQNSPAWEERYEHLTNDIADEIESAVDEAIGATLGENVVHSKEWLEQELARTRAEALEEAAKLFEQPCHCPEQAFDCDHVDAPASRIRALVSKDKP
jgi:hypothetical protein